jgi:hypothetical protein
MPAFQFNSQGIDAQYGGGGGLPLGRHPVVIAESALKPTKDQTGGFLELRIEAIDGPAKGLSTFDRLNLHNKNPQAVEIANKQLAAYCHVTGVFAFNATEELHGKPFIVEMVARRDNPNQTEIGKIFDINGNEPGKAGSGAPTGQPTGGGAAWGGGGGAPPATEQPPAGGQPTWAGGGAPAGGAQPTGGGWNQGGGAPGGGAPWGQK